MRDLKFRVWDEASINHMVFISEFDDSTWDEILTAYSETIMQYVGLKDKNGKEIYEGDIVRLGSLELRFVIVYYEGRFALKDTRYLDDEFPMDNGIGLLCYRERIEVMGNIYEDKKLLEVGK